MNDSILLFSGKYYRVSIDLCVVYNFEKNIDFIGGNFPCVNVDIRGVALLMSTHVNWREVGGREEPNFGQRKL